MEHHNAVFIGKDENGKARYANLRGTLGDFKGEAYGSDKRHSFRLPAEKPFGSIHIFESAIDLLSYAIYMKCAGMEYRSENLISLAGVYQPKKDIEKSKLNTAKLLKDKYKNQKIEFNDEKLIRAAILLIHKNIIETYPDGVRNISALTKNTKLFKEIKQYIENLK